MVQTQIKAAASGLRASGPAFQRHMNGLLNTRFQLSPIGKSSYDGEIRQSYITERLRLADIRFSPHSTRLLPGKMPPRSGHSFLVSWQVEGTARVRQFGREAEIGPGQLFFVDTAHPFEIETDEIRTRSVHLDSQFWQEVFPERAQYTAAALSGDSGMGQLCTQMIDQLFAAALSLPPETVWRIASSFANLFAVAMLTGIDVTPQQERRGLLIDRAKQFARGRLGDPDLGCEAIAGHLNLSVRYVHQLFGEGDKTVMRWVWGERLNGIARDLRNQKLRHKSVSAIAFDWGFSEAAHFSRSFKTRFGVSPTVFRDETALAM